MPATGTVERGNGRSSAVCGGTVQKHRGTLVPQRLDGPNGVEQHEVEVLVRAELIDETNLEIA